MGKKEKEANNNNKKVVAANGIVGTLRFQFNVIQVHFTLNLK